MDKRITKHLFFNNIEEAERFKQLYDGRPLVDYFPNYWVKKYYGHKIIGKTHVFFTVTTEEFEKIKKAIGLKEKRWAGHLCYIYEG